MRKVCVRVVAVFQFCLLAAGAAAQSNAVTGRVVDPQGASVAGAEVTLLPATGRGRTTRSNADGTFSLEAAGTGPQTLVVRAPGFAEFSQPVTAGGASMDVTLQVAGLRGGRDRAGGAARDRRDRQDEPAGARHADDGAHRARTTSSRNRAPTTSSAALQNVPGVYAFTNYGIYEGYTFRGFLDLFPSLANQLLDGVRHEGNRINTQLTNIDRIEVLKGPSSALYGGGAIGATVNMIRKKPSAQPAYDATLAAGSWTTGRGQFGATGRLCVRRARSIASTSASRARKATVTTTRSASRSRRRWPGVWARATR